MEKYKGTAPYTPSHEDEITLGLSDLVVILHKYDDGWCMAKNETTLETGLLPMNFLAPYNQQTPSTPLADKGGPLTSNSSVIQFIPTPISPIASLSIEEPIKDIGTVLEKFENVNFQAMERRKLPEHLGFFKLMVVGDSGIGKSEFLQNFCSSNFVKKKTESNLVNNGIMEISASTLPELPSYISEEQSAYNLKFIDTPGFGAHVDATLTIEPIISYLKTQFSSTLLYLSSVYFINVQPNSRLFNIIAGNSGAHTHINICIYGILHRLKPIDKEFMKVLSPFVPIVPVIVKSDTLDASQVFKLKESILKDLKISGIQIYSFGLDITDCLAMAQNEKLGAVPFAISNASFPTNTTSQKKINEIDNFKEKLIFTFEEDIRRTSTVKFCDWKYNLDQSIKPVKQTNNINISQQNLNQNQKLKQQPQYQQQQTQVYNHERKPSVATIVSETDTEVDISKPKLPAYQPKLNIQYGVNNSPTNNEEFTKRDSVFGGGRQQVQARYSSRPAALKSPLAGNNGVNKDSIDSFSNPNNAIINNTSNTGSKSVKKIGFNYGSLKKAITGIKK
ncbi:Cell division control protein 11 [Clydaea vesicula]|uniref:Cell division control protein 11 n=1 Tax=Clydaea vesicula TaxID=447962 RepID=A0AAD5U5W5_9FUNG|nr:Cell division control protein 11 [Clydaea vesicula]KAJ3386990.1 Cell division control protein 11 [Lobulomyces angularis]